MYPNDSQEIQDSMPKPKIQGVNYGKFKEDIQFIIVTVNDNEFNAATVYIKAPDIENLDPSANATKIENNVYVGMLEGHRVALLQTKPAAPDLSAKLEHFPNAKYIVVVGMGYEFPQNIKLGDVMVSKSISNFGILRFNENGTVTPKDLSIIPMKQDIYGLFQCNKYTPFPMEVAEGRIFVPKHGVVVSSPNLIGSSSIREQIYEMHVKIGNPLGGEMEGCEVLRLQEEKGFSVIIIKGVADFGDGNKELTRKWQYTSSKAATFYLKCKLAEYPG